MVHNYKVKVYHADTDCYGIVWHGSYLRFCEQARAEFAATVGMPMKSFEEENVYTPLTEANIKYKFPAKVHDLLNIETTIEKLTPVRCTMLQKITNVTTAKEVADVLVTFVCTDNNGNLLRKMPSKIYEALLKEKC